MFSDLLHMEENKLTSYLRRLDCSELEVKTLLTAFKNLKVCTGSPDRDFVYSSAICFVLAVVVVIVRVIYLETAVSTDSHPGTEMKNVFNLDN